MTADFKTLLASAKLPERTVPVCLRGDLVAEHEAADRALVEAQRQPSTGKEGSGVAELVERVEQIQAEMRDSIYPFVMRALTRPRFRALMAAHPPKRQDNGDPDPADAQLGFEREAFFEALLKLATVDPEMGIDAEAYFADLLAGKEPVLPDGDWPELFDKLTDKQYGDLTDAAWYVNRDEVIVPFSRAASLARRNSDDE